MKRALFLILLLLFTALPAPAESAPGVGALEILGPGPGQLNVGLGLFNIADGGASAAGRVEYRFGSKLFRLGPLVGVLANADAGLLTYAGLYLEFAWRQFVFTPQSGIGAYRQGESKDLGGTLQFRSALELAWRPARGRRIGIQIGHVSNAALHHRNPGENDLFLTVSLPF